MTLPWVSDARNPFECAKIEAHRKGGCENSRMPLSHREKDNSLWTLSSHSDRNLKYKLHCKMFHRTISNPTDLKRHYRCEIGNPVFTQFLRLFMKTSCTSRQRRQKYSMETLISMYLEHNYFLSARNLMLQCQHADIGVDYVLTKLANYVFKQLHNTMRPARSTDRSPFALNLRWPPITTGQFLSSHVPFNVNTYSALVRW